ncbi:hypothetical protein HNQ91_000799 [Filimonas zeae]|uniref:SusD family protein n=1 Tax=Filimonas zeae TaxID=1737353 RepID=A0A917MRY0_9BACT|nr:RagB/SusD family nutrient uptake outer membrane protein [Filimonas zeae]MDR6337777.1 hypothetical protein [Filimonas zeae]GGH60213.1 hypothetical protein GCM10011379_07820 [Filimonas zeae]
MRKLTYIILAALTLTSCKKWLDVNPQTQIPREELFSSEKGFEEALIGIYTKCTETDLYGGELTFGITDVMAQNYAFQNDYLKYAQTAKYDFKYKEIIEKKDKIWRGLYNGILNANQILLNIEEKKALFQGKKYALIKGEALALRAYLHFDIFRLFGQSTLGGTQKGIPYVTTYSTAPTAISTPDEAMTKMIEDLNAAKLLLKDADSITTKSYVIGYPNEKGQTETTATSSFLRDRRHRLNYYAVCAQLARVYLHKGDKANALANATEVIQSNKFVMADDAGALKEVTPKLKDRILYKELVFAWYLPQKSTWVRDRFQKDNENLSLSPEFYRTMFETNGVGGEDVRAKEWMEIIGSTEVEITKYRRELTTDKDDTTSNLHPLMAPAIRISELYYIAAECSYATSPAQASAYLDYVRFKRSINQAADISTQDKFYTELLKEARKEWIGEGQIFYMYKRLNRNIPGQQGLVTVPSATNWVLPLPADEIQFGGR